MRVGVLNGAAYNALAYNSAYAAFVRAAALLMQEDQSALAVAVAALAAGVDVTGEDHSVAATAVAALAGAAALEQGDNSFTGAGALTIAGVLDAAQAPNTFAGTMRPGIARHVGQGMLAPHNTAGALTAHPGATSVRAH